MDFSIASTAVDSLEKAFEISDNLIEVADYFQKYFQTATKNIWNVAVDYEILRLRTNISYVEIEVRNDNETALWKIFS